MSRRTQIAGLAVVVAVAALLPTGAAQAADPSATTGAVTVEDGVLEIAVTVDGLAAGEVVDPGSVRVTVGDQTWPATARLTSDPRSAVSRRAVLVVDTSGSMGAAGIADARAASRRFLTVVPPDVAVGLVTFSSQAQLVVPPTRDRAKVAAALDSMRPAGDTKLFDGIDTALRALGREGERALIVLSDGKDTASDATLAGVDGRLAASGAAVDLVAFRTEDAQVDVLARLAASSKGRVSEATSGAQLAEAFAAAGRDLADELTVTVVLPDGVDPGAVQAAVALDAGGRTLTTTAGFEVPAESGATVDARGTAATARPVVDPGVPWMLPAVLVVFFLALFGLTATALSPGTWGRSGSMLRSKEIERYGLTGVSGVQWTPAEDRVGSASQTALAWADRAVHRRGLDSSWTLALDRAGVALRPKEWLILRLGAALAVAAAAVVLLPWWFLAGCLGGLLGWVATGLYLRIKGKRRLKAFADALPDVLQLIAGSLRTGFSLPQAVDNAAKDGEEPIAGEFARALAESRLGIPLEDTLERVAERMDSTDLAWTVMAIRIAREVGGNLAEVLLSTAETMRERGRIQRQVRVLSAEGRLSAYVLIALPLGITAFMVLFRGDYIAPLIEDPIGWVMTGYGVLSVLAGTWWMSRMIKLEV